MTTGIALTDLSRHHRKSLILAIVLGGVSLLVSFVLKHPLVGVMLCVGLALGLLNNLLMVGATARFSASENPRKRRFAFGTLQRLFGITAVALVPVFVFRPEGLGVVVGLAVFQIIMLAVMSGSLLREVNRE